MLPLPLLPLVLVLVLPPPPLLLLPPLLPPLLLPPLLPPPLPLLLQILPRILVHGHPILPCNLDRPAPLPHPSHRRAVEAVIASIRQKNGVTEQMMSAAMVQHQADPVVQAAVTALREAINGKAPPGYAAAAEAAQAESAKQRVRRAASGKQRRKG